MTEQSPAAHKAFFGDAEYELRLTPAMVLELERSTGVGIGLLCTRVFNSQFQSRDVSETIRLALVGGGTQPAKAASLVETYVPAQPLIHSYTLAVDILERLWFGSEKQDNAD